MLRYIDSVPFKRITVDLNKMGGEPCIRDLRMPVATILKLFAEGWSTNQILKEWPDLEPEDLTEALLFGAEAVRPRYSETAP